MQQPASSPPGGCRGGTGPPCQHTPRTRQTAFLQDITISSRSTLPVEMGSTSARGQMLEAKTLERRAVPAVLPPRACSQQAAPHPATAISRWPPSQKSHSLPSPPASQG